jgi:hypothetical protein
MPVILATQKAEIRRILVQSQPWQTVCGRPYLEKPHHKKRAGEVAQVVGCVQALVLPKKRGK